MKSDESFSLGRELHELISPITVASGRAQLLERHIQQTESLSSSERDLMLDDVTAVLDAMRVLRERIQARFAQGEIQTD